MNNIEALIADGGEITVGPIGPIECAATAADGHNALAMLVTAATVVLPFLSFLWDTTRPVRSSRHITSVVTRCALVRDWSLTFMANTSTGTCAGWLSSVAVIGKSFGSHDICPVARSNP